MSSSVFILITQIFKTNSPVLFLLLLFAVPVPVLVEFLPDTFSEVLDAGGSLPTLLFAELPLRFLLPKLSVVVNGGTQVPACNMFNDPSQNCFNLPGHFS